MTLTLSKPLHPAESTHWYTKDGLPAYQVKGKNGKMRNTTLRDARTEGYLPSVTTIIGCAAKPGLDRWKQEQVLLAALTTERIVGESENEYLARIMDDSREQGRKAAERGTAIHESIERFYSDRSVKIHQDHIRAVESTLTAHFACSEWIAEKSFASTFGFGGKTDLCAPGIVVDIKTKEFSKDKLPEAYDEHLMQLAAYREGLEMPDARCANLFVSSSTPGLVHLVEWTQDDLERGWLMFEGLMSYWYAKTGLKR